MKVKRFLQLSIYILSLSGALFIFIQGVLSIPFIPGFLSDRSYFIIGIAYMLKLVFGTLWFVFSIIDLIVFFVKYKNDNKKPLSICLWICAGTSLIIFLYYSLEGFTKQEYIIDFLNSSRSWIRLTLCVLPLLLWLIVNINKNKVTSTILKGITAVIELISAIYLGPEVLLAALVIVPDTIIPFIEDKPTES